MSEDTNQQAALYKALAAAQGEFRPIVKNRSVQIRPREGAPYTFRYADMEELIAATRPALAKHGMAVIQTVSRGADGMEYLETGVLHADGGCIWSRLPIIPFKGNDDPKKFGAVLTYIRRYQYSSLLCLAADDDLDEDGGDGGEAAAKNKPKPRKAEARQVEVPASSSAEHEGRREEQAPRTQSDVKMVGAGELAWATKKMAALGLAADHLLATHGISDAKAMTMEQFSAVKADLLKR